ncbi:hypothetical protein PJL18_04008 [Paenarthrobacter nicotinovorans]|nr:hypothetical protein [Paenarthrobacter nicotinovorans]
MRSGVDNGTVEVRVRDDGDGGVVLRGRTHHGGASDVDLLHDVILRRAGLHGLDERVQVHHHEVEGFDLHAGKGVHVRRNATVGQDAAVHAGVQGLDPAVQHFRGAGDFFDFLDRDACGGNLLGGGAGGNNGDACCVQALRELLQSRLVVNRDQCTADGNTVKLRQAHKSLRLSSRRCRGWWGYGEFIVFRWHPAFASSLLDCGPPLRGLLCAPSFRHGTHTGPHNFATPVVGPALRAIVPTWDAHQAPQLTTAVAATRANSGHP